MAKDDAAAGTKKDFAPKRDYRQELTNAVIKMLEDGVPLWKKPWHGAGKHYNPVTGTVYGGGNAFRLKMAALREGYKDPRWVTVRQLMQLNAKAFAEQGRNVELRPGATGKGFYFYDLDAGKYVKQVDMPVRLKEGSKGEAVEYWKELGSSPDRSATAEEGAGDEDSRHGGSKKLVAFHSTVFNAECVIGMPATKERHKLEFEPLQLAEEASRLSGVTVRHVPDDKACYYPAHDCIDMPPRETFKSVAGYYSTLMHEHAHATGHKDRLARPGIIENHGFGSPGYAREELVAELGSVFLAAELGVPLELSQHASYVDSWLKALRSDKNEIFRAASQAEKAVEMLTQPLRERGMLKDQVELLDLGDFNAQMRGAEGKAAAAPAEKAGKAKTKGKAGVER